MPSPSGTQIISQSRLSKLLAANRRSKKARACATVMVQAIMECETVEPGPVHPLLDYKAGRFVLILEADR